MRGICVDSIRLYSLVLRSSSSLDCWKDTISKVYKQRTMDNIKIHVYNQRN